MADITSNSHQLVGLQEYTQYEVTAVAVNDIGPSTLAPVALERTRESGEQHITLVVVFIL